MDIFEESNRNKHMTLVPTDESKDILKRYDQLCSETRDVIRLITNNSSNYDEKYMKVKLDDDLPLKKTLELQNMVIVVKVVFHDGSKYYLQLFLDECLYGSHLRECII